MNRYKVIKCIYRLGFSVEMIQINDIFEISSFRPKDNTAVAVFTSSDFKEAMLYFDGMYDNLCLQETITNV